MRPASVRPVEVWGSRRDRRRDLADDRARPVRPRAQRLSAAVDPGRVGPVDRPGLARRAGRSTVRSWIMAAIAAVAVVDFIGDKIGDRLRAARGRRRGRAGHRSAGRPRGHGQRLGRPGVRAVVGRGGRRHAREPGRRVVRPASTAFTGGAGNPVLSLGEDSISTVLSFAAVIVPVVAFLLVVVLFTLLIWGARLESPARGRTPDAAGPAAAPRPGATTFPQNE